MFRWHSQLTQLIFSCRLIVAFRVRSGHEMGDFRPDRRTFQFNGRILGHRVLLLVYAENGLLQLLVLLLLPLLVIVAQDEVQVAVVVELRG